MGRLIMSRTWLYWITVDSSGEIPRVDMDESPVPCMDEGEPEGGTDFSFNARWDMCYVMEPICK